MRFIPISCEICAHSALVAAESIVQGQAVCPNCGGSARSLPGESYAAEDATLFNELRRAVQEAGITPLQAAQLGNELEARNHAEPGRGLKRLAQLAPSLGSIELIVPNQAVSLRKAEGMLATLLESLSNRRSASGLAPASDAEPGLKASVG